MNTSNKNKFGPIKKANLSKQLADHMIKQIENGSIELGAKLPNEIQLASFFNVSRNILRESLKILESYGIIDTTDGKGTFISASALVNIRNKCFFDSIRSNSSIHVSMETRLILEPQLAYYAALRCTSDDLEKIESIIRPYSQSNDNAEELLDDYDFHIQLSKISGNEILSNLITSLVYSLRDSDYAQFNKYVDRITLERSIKEHHLIVQTLREHNPEAARKLMTEHLSTRINVIESFYRSNIELSELDAQKIVELHSPL